MIKVLPFPNSDCKVKFMNFMYLKTAKLKINGTKFLYQSFG